MIKIREGQIDDLSRTLELIKELAEFEKAPDEVTNTLEQMKIDGFGEHPVYGLIVAEDEKKIVGISVYYYRYSTWKGKRLFLEDLIVTEDNRRSGIGKKLFDKTVEIAKKTGCSGVMWQVLDWNTHAIEFYKSYKTKFDREWINCSLDF